MHKHRLPSGHICLVDDEDILICKDYPWIRHVNKWPYVVTSRGDIMHRIILKVRPGQMVDHINGNGLDNRRSNLRVCSHQQNMCNRRMHKNNKTGHPGVYRSESGSWGARIKVRNKLIYLGCYLRKSDAITAKKKADEIYFGDFAPNHLIRYGVV